MKCSECKFCIGFEDGYYICNIGDLLEAIEECIANNDECICDGYVEDMDDNETA